MVTYIKSSITSIAADIVTVIKMLVSANKWTARFTHKKEMRAENLMGRSSKKNWRITALSIAVRFKGEEHVHVLISNFKCQRDNNKFHHLDSGCLLSSQKIYHKKPQNWLIKIHSHLWNTITFQGINKYITKIERDKYQQERWLDSTYKRITHFCVHILPIHNGTRYTLAF